MSSATWYEGTAQLLSLTEFIGWTIYRRRRGGNRSTRRKSLTTSFRKCHIQKPQNSSPNETRTRTLALAKARKTDVLTVTPRPSPPPPPPLVKHLLPWGHTSVKWETNTFFFWRDEYVIRAALTSPPLGAWLVTQVACSPAAPQRQHLHVIVLYTHACTLTRTHTHTHTHTHTLTYTLARAHASNHTNTNSSVRLHTHTHTDTHTHTHIHARIHTRTYAHTYSTHAHTYTHTHAHVCLIRSHLIDYLYAYVSIITQVFRLLWSISWIRMHMYVCPCESVSIFASGYTCVCACMYSFVLACTCVHVRICKRMFVCVYGSISMWALRECVRVYDYLPLLYIPCFFLTIPSPPSPFFLFFFFFFFFWCHFLVAFLLSFCPLFLPFPLSLPFLFFLSLGVGRRGGGRAREGC